VNINDFLRSREVTNVIRFLLDDCLPPVLRDRRLLMSLVARIYCGKAYAQFDVDFKEHVLHMSDADLAALYQTAPGCGENRIRESDLTAAEKQYVLTNVRGPNVLEVGCGTGTLARSIAQLGYQVVASDVDASMLQRLADAAGTEGLPLRTQVAFVETLPFPDHSFDTVVAAHTLEHVRDFEKAVEEMVRVAQHRIIIVVPRQRYYRYTVDYHLHFFPDPEQLILRVGLPHRECRIVTGDLCYTGYLS
jgi:SAM-dependent methyltransferase